MQNTYKYANTSINYVDNILHKIIIAITLTLYPYFFVELRNRLNPSVSLVAMVNTNIPTKSDKCNMPIYIIYARNIYYFILLIKAIK